MTGITVESLVTPARTIRISNYFPSTLYDDNGNTWYPSIYIEYDDGEYEYISGGSYSDIDLGRVVDINLSNY